MSIEQSQENANKQQAEIFRCLVWSVGTVTCLLESCFAWYINKCENELECFIRCHPDETEDTCGNTFTAC